ncbi:MAG: HAMP domain-containing sensor histidine kinase [Candidatus Acidiferrales bacterium]
MKLARPTGFVLTAWCVFVGGFIAIALLVPEGAFRRTASDLFACMVPLFANSCLLYNAASPYRRRNSFWMLLAMGCTLWLFGHLVFTYNRVAGNRDLHSPFLGDSLFFLHTVPFMAAVALAPHARKMRETLRYGLLDFLLLTLLWFYVYVFAAMPWKLAYPDPALFRMRDFETYMVENLVVVIGFGYLFFHAHGGWKKIYGHFLGASSLYVVGFITAHIEVGRGHEYSGTLLTVPVMAAFVWMATAGIIAKRTELLPEPLETNLRRDKQWPVHLAMLGVLAAPLLAIWNVLFSTAPAPVRQFRLLATLFAIVGATAIIFYRQHLVYVERTGLVHELWESLENVKRLQTHFVQSEKLASLGQLAAGAAHEINNPLTAILGYSEVLTVENAPDTRPHTLGAKIREQARRTKDLVTNLLSFARQVPAEKQLLDLNTVLTGAVQLRNLDLREKQIRVELENRSILPAVHGDPNQLLQVFYHLISNAVDAMDSAGGGVLLIRTLRERNNVVIEFSDTGPGMKEPEKVFDPFYTTKPVGKGTGLGLSICYGVMQEHGGSIVGFNRPEGGCTFRLELPAVLAVFPQTPPLPPVSVHSR